LDDRRFTEHAESFIVRDATGQALGYFYFATSPVGARRKHDPQAPADHER
jgi:hypothetical protein